MNNNFNTIYRSIRNYKLSSASNIRPYNRERDFKAIYGYDNITSFKSKDVYIYMK